MSESNTVVEKSSTVVEQSPAKKEVKPFTGTLPMLARVTGSTPDRGFCFVTDAADTSDEAPKLFAHMYGRGKPSVVGDKIVVTRLVRTKQTVPSIGALLVVTEVAPPRDGGDCYQATTWAPQEEYGAAEQQLASRYVVSPEPRQNRANINWLEPDQLYGRALTSSGELVFVPESCRVGVELRGMELTVVRAKAEPMYLGEVYFRNIVDSNRPGGLRVMQGWIPCAELDAADAELAKARAAMEESEKRFLRQDEGTYTPAGAQDEYRKNRAKISYLSEEEGVVALVAEGGEVLYAPWWNRRWFYLSSATGMVTRLICPPAQQRPLAVGDTVFYGELTEAGRGGKCRMATWFTVAEEVEKLDAAAAKSGKNQAERAAEIAAAESERKRQIAAARESSGKASGQGKKNKK